jgi:hypothetical protein
MKIDDVLTLPKLGRKLRKKMKGGKTEKKVPITGDKILGKGFHIGYSQKIDNTERDQDTWHGNSSDV